MLSSMFLGYFNIETIICQAIYVSFIICLVICWLLVMFLISFFSVSILERLREAGMVALRLHNAGLLAMHLREVAYVRLVWSEERMFETSCVLLCFFVIVSACLHIISQGKCYPNNVPIPHRQGWD